MIKDVSGKYVVI